MAGGFGEQLGGERAHEAGPLEPPPDAAPGGEGGGKGVEAAAAGTGLLERGVREDLALEACSRVPIGEAPWRGDEAPSAGAGVGASVGSAVGATVGEAVGDGVWGACGGAV